MFNWLKLDILYYIYLLSRVLETGTLSPPSLSKCIELLGLISRVRVRCYTSLPLRRLMWSLGAAGWEQPQLCSSSSFGERRFLYSPRIFGIRVVLTGRRLLSRSWICRPSFLLDSLGLERPDALAQDF